MKNTPPKHSYQKRDELMRENALLRKKLASVEHWMQREVDGSLLHLRKEDLRTMTRNHFDNIFEESVVENIRAYLNTMFSGDFSYMPEHALERMMDAEIFWYTLQKYPFMDGVPLVLSYQKILDSWIEEEFVAPWRVSQWGQGKTVMMYASEDADWKNIIMKKYTLSLGRLFHLIDKYRNGVPLSEYEKSFISYIKKKYPERVSGIFSEEFYDLFSLLIQGGFFSDKRHAGKVSYQEARKIREICMGKDGIFSQIFRV